jgi:chorismate mutase
MSDEDRELERLRTSIDEIDRVLVRLLNQRAKYALAIGRVKKKTHASVYSPEREHEVFGNVTQANDGPLSVEALRRLFERIMDEARRLERAVVAGEVDEPQEE